MTKFNVEITEQVKWDYEIWADTKEEAEELAEDRFFGEQGPLGDWSVTDAHEVE